MSSYSDHIKKTILPKIQKELGLKNVMAVPQLEKIVVNVGIGTRLKTSKDFSDIVENIAAITGQKPVVQKSKKSISNFKLRQGIPNGLTTTLRRKKMWDFLNRLINVAIPRIRDFQGLNEKCFDGQGNVSIGIKDCSIFPEVKIEDLTKIHGLSITIVSTTKDDSTAKMLLKQLNFPFKKPAAVETKQS